MAEYEVTIMFKVEADSLADVFKAIPVMWDEQKYKLIGAMRKEDDGSRNQSENLGEV